MTPPLRVGTRRSLLARAQTGLVLAQLARLDPALRFEEVPVETSGDRDRSPGGSPDFTDAIDRALLRGSIDLAIHSAKDLPVRLDPRFDWVASPRREDPRDCLVIRGGRRVLSRSARVGSSSLRRRAQLLRWRPDVKVVELRGNVDRRLAQLKGGDLDATILARAGLLRLGRVREASSPLPLTDFLPAPAQGALAVLARAGESPLGPAGERLDHAPTRAAVAAERAFAGALGGNCNLPVAALGRVRAGRLQVTGEVLRADGQLSLRAGRSGALHDASRLGAELGAALVDRGGRELVRARIA